MKMQSFHRVKSIALSFVFCGDFFVILTEDRSHITVIMWVILLHKKLLQSLHENPAALSAVTLCMSYHTVTMATKKRQNCQ